jgi:uncharacterized tellurite resistance protein B-like protein
MLHLLLHCCCVDGEWNDDEVHAVRSVMFGLYNVDEQWLQENMAVYHRYATRDKHNPSYLQFLVRQINPSDPQRLLWHCAQVTVADDVVSFAEELFFERLAPLLHLSLETVKAVHRRAWQARAVEKNKPAPPKQNDTP